MRGPLEFLLRYQFNKFSDPDLEYIYIILDNVFLIFPHFCLGRGLMEMAIQQAYLDAYAELGFEQERDKPILGAIGFPKNIIILNWATYFRKG